MSEFQASELESRLSNLSDSTSSIKQLSLWIISHRNHFQVICSTWYKEFVNANEDKKLNFIYVVDEIVQRSKIKHPEFIIEFGELIKKSLAYLVVGGFLNEETNSIIWDMIKTWRERKIFDTNKQNDFEKIWKEGTEVDTVTLKRKIESPSSSSECKSPKRTKLDENLYCYLCQESGHGVSDSCLGHAVCRSCGVMGHIRKDCPKTKTQIYQNVIKLEIDENKVTRESKVPLGQCVSQPELGAVKSEEVNNNRNESENNDISLIAQFGCRTSLKMPFEGVKVKEEWKDGKKNAQNEENMERANNFWQQYGCEFNFNEESTADAEKVILMNEPIPAISDSMLTTRENDLNMEHDLKKLPYSKDVTVASSSQNTPLELRETSMHMNDTDIAVPDISAKESNARESVKICSVTDITTKEVNVNDPCTKIPSPMDIETETNSDIPNLMDIPGKSLNETDSSDDREIRNEPKKILCFTVPSPKRSINVAVMHKLCTKAITDAGEGTKAITDAGEGTKAITDAGEGTKAITDAGEGTKAITDADEGTKDINDADEGTKAITDADEGIKAITDAGEGTKAITNAGEVLKIVVFPSVGEAQVMVEFSSQEAADKALKNLNDKEIHGLGTLHIKYARKNKLKVSINNEFSWDFTTGPSIDAQSTNSCDSNIGMGHNREVFKYSTTELGDNIAEQKRASLVQVGSCVVLVYNTHVMTNCDVLFNLFCQYGQVHRIIFMRAKPGCAILEMADPESAERAIHHLHEIKLFGCPLKLYASKQSKFVGTLWPEGVFRLPDGSPSAGDYSLYRQKNVSLISVGPSKKLRFQNLPEIEEWKLFHVFRINGAPQPQKIKWDRSSNLEPGKIYLRSGLFNFGSIEESCDALGLMNHVKIYGTFNRKDVVCKLKLCFAPDTS